MLAEEFRKNVKGSFTVSEAEKCGVSRSQLAGWATSGDVERVARGIYRFSDDVCNEQPEIEILVKRGTQFRVVLQSALRLHDFTTALPSSVWIALPRGGRVPKVDFPLEVVFLSGRSWEYGSQTVNVQSLAVPTFSPAKTVADLFKFRNKTGLDIAVESLREGLRKKLFSVDELLAAAEADRVARIVTPYLEAIIG